MGGIQDREKGELDSMRMQSMIFRDRACQGRRRARLLLVAGWLRGFIDALTAASLS
jgi:hypothetical protein